MLLYNKNGSKNGGIKLKIAVGSDNNAFKMKEAVKEYLLQLGYEVKDYGCHSEDEVDYPHIAFDVAEGIVNKEAERGILMCGTGIGMAISANKVPGIRAAQVLDPYSAERAELSNNAQIITFGALTMGVEAVKSLIKIYLDADFEKNHKAGSARKVQQIIDKEKSNGSLK